MRSGPYLNDTRRLDANTGGLLVEHGARALLIDAGFGPRAVPEDPAHPDRGAVHGGSLPGNLALLGRSPDDIDTVAFTHLHRRPRRPGLRRPTAVHQGGLRDPQGRVGPSRPRAHRPRTPDEAGGPR
ncbi:MBL fold metallo-hydrolase [Streptomyces sp. B21-101]|uniref:MBL fold metallo-hydrolase n=1 Tax=Streptomyces sp. B21-101 TaxID=3039415 RepID=UPI002FF02D7F